MLARLPHMASLPCHYIVTRRFAGSGVQRPSLRNNLFKAKAKSIEFSRFGPSIATSPIILKTPNLALGYSTLTLQLPTMQRIPIPLLSTLRLKQRALPSLTHTRTSDARHSSGSPTKTNVPDDHFIKTGEKPQDPRDQVSRSYEYSQSGGDDMVAQQSSASFDVSRLLSVSINLKFMLTQFSS